MTVPVVEFIVKGAASNPRPLGRPYTIVYDGACKVCTKLSRTLQQWDREKKFEVIPSQTSGIAARFPWIPAKSYTESLQVVAKSGETLQGAAGIERILDELPKGKLISWVFSIPFARALAERLYRWFARNRYRLGCGEHCQYRALAVDYGEDEQAGRG